MSGSSKVAVGAAKALFYCSVLTLGLWLVWYGQYQWAGYDCKDFKPGVPGGHPAGWSLSTPCAVTWTKPLLQANLGFLFLVPAVAALSAVFVVGLGVHNMPCSSRKQTAVARLQCWGSIQLPPKRFWLWWCDGLSVKDAFIIAVWALYNAVWYSTILSKALARAGHEGLSPRGVAKGFASLMGPNVVLLLLPVSRGSVISQALGLPYPEGIRYHRWVGQWVALLATLHGFIYWFSWAAMGTWTRAVLRNGPDLSHLFGGLALICTLLLWTTSQEPFRRKSYQIYKVLHHIGFWGFMIMGCAHYWSFFWYFVPGMLLYAVDGVFRLHQMFAGRSGSLTTGASTASVAGKPGMSGVNAEVLKVDVCPSETMCSLLLASPEFGVAPAGIVWLNVPAISLLQWHAFDYTASEMALSADGRVYCGATADKNVVQGETRTALTVHIKAYNRWTKSLLRSLAQRGQQQQHLTIRLQGPYADPPAAIGQPDGIAIVAGGNGIASALPVFEELSASGVATQGLPALLLWACRKGYEFEFMAAPVLAAAQALGLNLTIHLYITDLTHIKGSPTSAPHAASDTMFGKDQAIDQNSTPVPTLAVASASSASSDSGVAKVVEEAGAPSDTAAAASSSAAAGGAGGSGSVVGPTSLCPVVAFASFAAQLSFKAVLHLAVFAGFLLGLFIATYVGGALPLEAGQQHWPTYHLGPALVLVPAGCAVGLGLITLWAGLFAQRRIQGSNAGLALSRSPAAAIAAMSGCLSELLPVGNGGPGTGKGKLVEPASFLLRVPSASGSAEVLPVVASMPSVSGVVQGWVNTLLQLPSAAAAAAKDEACSRVQGRCDGVVYACGPTPLDHATQLAVASITAKQGKSGGSGGCRQVMLQFVRKAQML